MVDAQPLGGQIHINQRTPQNLRSPDVIAGQDEDVQESQAELPSRRPDQAEEQSSGERVPHRLEVDAEVALRGVIVSLLAAGEGDAPEADEADDQERNGEPHGPLLFVEDFLGMAVAGWLRIHASSTCHDHGLFTCCRSWCWPELLGWRHRHHPKGSRTWPPP